MLKELEKYLRVPGSFEWWLKPNYEWYMNHVYEIINDLRDLGFINDYANFSPKWKDICDEHDFDYKATKEFLEFIKPLHIYSSMNDEELFKIALGLQDYIKLSLEVNDTPIKECEALCRLVNFIINRKHINYVKNNGGDEL